MVFGEVSRRTVTRGMVWTTPVIAVAAAAPAFAASPCTRTYQVRDGQFGGGGNPFLGPSIATAAQLTGTPPATVTVTFTDVSPYDEADPSGAGGANAGVPRGEGKHMSFGASAYNANSNNNNGNVGNDNNKGLILNLRGGPLGTQNGRVVRVTFSKEVKDLRFDVRDLSWHNTGDRVRESISFSTDTTVANQTNRSDGSGGGLNVLGAVPAGTEIYRTSSGSRPSAGAYYDIKISVPVPITTFTLTYGRKVGETTTDFAAAQLADFTFCTAW